MNPEHIFKGTCADNGADMARKGRAASGERHGFHLHPESIVRGAIHWRRKHPELGASGDRNGARLYPEHIARGEKHPNAKLTNVQAAEIKRRALAGERKSALAIEFGVDGQIVRRIARGDTWKATPR